MPDIKKKAKDYYNSKDDAFEGVREVGRAAKNAILKVGKTVAEKMPTFRSEPTPSPTEDLYKVKGPFEGQDMTPTTRMNSPKKYKKG